MVLVAKEIVMDNLILNSKAVLYSLFVCLYTYFLINAYLETNVCSSSF